MLCLGNLPPANPACTCHNVAQMLLETAVLGSELWPGFGRIWPMWAMFWPKRGAILTNAGRCWPVCGQVWPIFANIVDCSPSSTVWASPLPLGCCLCRSVPLSSVLHVRGKATNSVHGECEISWVRGGASGSHLVSSRRVGQMSRGRFSQHGGAVCVVWRTSHLGEWVRDPIGSSRSVSMSGLAARAHAPSRH